MTFAPDSPLQFETGSLIVHRYDLCKRLSRAEKMVGTRPLDQLLRSHRDGAIRGEEIAERDNLDEALTGLGILHIGGFDTPDQYLELGLPFDFIAHLLGHEDVRRYYEALYPYAPPILLREKLLNPMSAYATGLAAERQADGWTALFHRFLLLDAMFNAPGPLDRFLSVLDSYVINGIDFYDLRAAFRNEARMRNLLENRTGRMLVEGVQDFFEFSEALEEFLKSAERFPLFRSLVWFNFGYWYGGGGDLMRRVADWSHELVRSLDERSQDSFEDDLQQSVRLESTMKSLTDLEECTEPVATICKQELARWTENVMMKSMIRSGSRREHHWD